MFCGLLPDGNTARIPGYAPLAHTLPGAWLSGYCQIRPALQQFGSFPDSTLNKGDFHRHNVVFDERTNDIFA